MTTGDPPLGYSWLASDRPVARLIARPMRRFLDTEAAGGIILLVAACAALLWANSPIGDSYESLGTMEISLNLGGFELSEDLRHWINDGLMVIFFFVVVLEIKRELVAGELREPRRVATLLSGGHATIAGVALGLLTPALPADPEGARDAMAEAQRLADDPDPETIRRTTIQAQELVSVAERLELKLHPWSSFMIVPLFALANAGVRLSMDDITAAASSPVVRGIVVGLVVGKVVGISGAAWLAVRVGAGVLPDEIGWRHVIGSGAVAGIGFTVALFISNLAFGSGEVAEEAKIGVFVASLIAAGLGVLLLRHTDRTEERT